MARKKSSKRVNLLSDLSTLDAGGGSHSIIGGMTGRNAPENYSTFSGFTKPDIRGVYGVPNDPPDPIRRPVDKIRVVQLPGRTVYVPVPTTKPPKKKPPKNKRGGRSGGGGNAAGVD